MAWIMFKQTSSPFGWISGRSGLMSSSRHWKGLWRFERGSWKFWPGWLRVKGIWRLEPALGASKHQRFGRVLEGSAGVSKAPEIFLNKKNFELSEKFFACGFPHASQCVQRVSVSEVQLTNRAHGMSPMTSPHPQKTLGYPLGFPNKQGGYEMEGLDYPTLDPWQRPMSMMRVVFFLNTMIIATVVIVCLRFLSWNSEMNIRLNYWYVFSC